VFNVDGGMVMAWKTRVAKWTGEKETRGQGERETGRNESG
jgi:hypothetical protein